MSEAQGLSLFDTALGRCAIVWSDAGVVGVSFPEGSDTRTLTRLRHRAPAAREMTPPPVVSNAIGAITDLLEAGRRDLQFINLDITGIETFDRDVYRATRTIPAVETVTYGELAMRAGHAGQARAVGQALGRNPFPIIVPCHRILAADGRLGGFSAPGGVGSKLRLLNLEKAQSGAGSGLFDHLPMAVRVRAPPEC